MTGYICRLCGAHYPFETPLYRCACGGFLDVAGPDMFDRGSLSSRPRTIWRYRESFGLPDDARPVSLGEGCTPLIERVLDGLPIFFKLDFLNPSGSFKDRGASVLATCLQRLGVKRAVEDSSGNAGAALAAYTAAAGIECTVFVPDYTPEAKTVQMKIYGARVVKVPGTRQDSSEAAIRSAEMSFYASHLWQPYFIMGLKSAGFELWEDLGGELPRAVILPLGSGGYVEGLHLAFESLRAAGYASRMPRLIGVQSRSCRPLHEAFVRGLEEYAEVQVERSVAEGIAVQRPPRSRAVLAAIRSSGGYTVAVEEQQILDAARRLASIGLYVEPTSAVTLAAWRSLDREDRKGAVLLLTGSGLKAKYAELLA
jgi:threonine synthase